MKKRILVIALFVLMVTMLVSAQEGIFDGSRPFVCAVIHANECDAAGCRQVTVHDLDAPRFFKVDIAKKHIIGTLEDQTTRDVEIQHVSHLNGNLILQGVQQGRAWSMVISETTGKMTLSVSSKNEGFVFFGDSFFQ
jgi:hypothetical protein